MPLNVPDSSTHRRPTLKALDLVHAMGDLFTQSLHIPLARVTMVPDDRFYDLLEELEGSLPGEFEKAKDILARQAQLLAEAREEAAALVEDARRQAQALVQEHELVRAAHDEAARIRTALDSELQTQQDGADRYADEVLGTLEDRVSRVLSTVQAGRQHIQAN